MPVDLRCMTTRIVTNLFLFFISSTPLLGQSIEMQESEINIPMRIAVKPLFDWAERSVDTLFTSEGYPEGWVQPSCDLRYRYKFWRGPLRLKASGQTLDLSFTGNYQMEGATRACVRGVVVSPWTPSCRCGFDEMARRVEVRFLNTLSIQPAYKIHLNIQPQKPIPTDPCKVCFWEQDVTNNVMDGLWEELTAAQRSMEKQYGKIDLRPHIVSAWSAMNRPIALGSYGSLMVRPLGFRVNRLAAVGDSIELSVGLRARPVVVNTVPQAYMTQVPTDWDKPSVSEGFRIRLEISLQNDSLSRVLNRTMMPMDIKPEKGPFRKKVIIDSLQIETAESGKVQCRLYLSGKYAGQLLMMGQPTWDSSTGILRLKDIDFDLKTRHLILGTAANWFDRPIRQWLEKKFQFSLSDRLAETRKWMEERLNSTDMQPLKCRGTLDKLEWLGWLTQPKSLVMRLGLQGRMQCTADLDGFSL